MEDAQMEVSIARSALPRRHLLATAVALPMVAIRSRPARAAEFSYRLATGTGITASINARLGQAAARVQEATGGRLAITLFPATQLGSDDEQLAQLQSGGVELLNTTGSRLAGIAPDAAITNLGFIFSGYETLWPAIDGPFGAAVRVAVERAGVLVLSKAADNGMRQITASDKPIRAPTDLRDFRIRLPDVATFTSLFKACGAIPVFAGIRELKPMLQAHTIDGQENNLAAIDFLELAGVQTDIAMTNHIWDPFWLLGNPRAIAMLPDNIQETLRSEFDRASAEQRDDVIKQNAALRAGLSADGFNIADIDRAPFRAALSTAGYYREFKQRFDTDLWRSLESIAGPLT